MTGKYIAVVLDCDFATYRGDLLLVTVPPRLGLGWYKCNFNATKVSSAAGGLGLAN